MVGGLAVGSVVGGVYNAPVVARGCLAGPATGVADVLGETALAVRCTPEMLLGKTNVDWQRRGWIHPSSVRKHSGGLREGFNVGCRAMQSELRRGVTGLYLEPLEGVREDGYPGMMSGGARGVLSALFAPVAGGLLMSEAVIRGSSNWVADPNALSSVGSAWVRLKASMWGDRLEQVDELEGEVVPAVGDTGRVSEIERQA